MELVDGLNGVEGQGLLTGYVGVTERARGCAVLALAAITAMGVGGCTAEDCRTAGADCLTDTTTGASDTDGATTGGGTGDSSTGGQDDSSPIATECVPRQGKDSCPDPTSSCLAEIMEKRYGSVDCGCTVGYVFSQVEAGPDPEVLEACCYRVRLEGQACVND